MNCFSVLKRSISGNIGLTFNKLQSTSNCSSEQIKTTGLFGINLLQTASGFEQFQEDALSECANLVQEAVDKNRKRKIVQVFDQLSNCLCKVADLSEFVRIGHPVSSYVYPLF